MSTINIIDDGEIGSSVRTKLNHLITYHNSGEGTLTEVVALRMGTGTRGLGITRSTYNSTAQVQYYYGAFGQWKPAFLRGDAARWNAGTGAFTPNQTGIYLFSLPPVIMGQFIEGNAQADISGIGLKVGSDGITGIFYKMACIAHMHVPPGPTRREVPATTYAIRLTAGVPVWMGLSLVSSNSTSTVNYSAYNHYAQNIYNPWGTSNTNLDISIFYLGEA